MIYRQGEISVDAHFARFGSKSYAIDKITSVDVREQRKTGCAWIFFIVLAVFAGFAAIAAIASPEDRGPSSEIGFFFAVAAIAGFLFYTRPKPVFHLMLATSSGEVQATTALKRETIDDLRVAIETAMVPHEVSRPEGKYP